MSALIRSAILKNSVLALALGMALTVPVSTQSSASETSSSSRLAAIKSSTSPAASGTRLAAIEMSTSPPTSEASPGPKTIKSDQLKTFPEIPGVSDPFQQLLYNALKISLERDDTMKEIDKTLNKFLESNSGKKDASADSLVAYKENYSCLEGSGALLEKDQELRSVCSTELAWEKRIDERYLLIVQLFSSLVASLDKNDPTSLTDFNLAKAKMTELVGDENSQTIIQQLHIIKLLESAADSSTKNSIPSGVLAKPWVPLTALEYCDKQGDLNSATQKSDPILQDLLSQIDKKSQAAKTSKARTFISNGLNVLSFVPGGVGDAAGYVQMAYDMGSGTEDARLLHSLYLYKRAEIRKRIILAACNLAIRDYETAAEEKNAFALSFSRSLISDLGGADALTQFETRD